MDKLTFMRLWDIYHGLLTPTQQEITDMYFNLDLTPSEIAEQKGITRQGVSECLKTCKKQLAETEEKLRFWEILNEISLEVSFRLTEAGRWAESFKAAHPEHAGEIAALEDVLARDYSDEVAKTLKEPAAQEILHTQFTADGKPVTKRKKGK